ncbi:hypothetical protein FIU92_02085 [Ruegeria sp. THAF33]|nr:hypothetical protein FIU92_02085 [Ruegeria sp. THAF33]
MRKEVFLAVCFGYIISWAGELHAEQVLRRLEPGDPDRKPILNAARLTVAADFGLKEPAELVFKVNKLSTGHPIMCVIDDWAVLGAQPGTRSSGSWAPLVLDCFDGEDHLDNLTVLLLSRENGDWQVVRGGSLCASDVPWLSWQDQPDLVGVVPQGVYGCFEAP